MRDPRPFIAIAAVLVSGLLAGAWPDPNRRGRALILFVFTGAAIAVALVLAAPAAFPLGDIAVMETYTREAATGHLLEGPYSRFGWHHPGPFYFYLLAPTYLLGGGTTAALSAGVLVLSLTVVAMVVWISDRTGGAAVSAPFLWALTAMAWRLDGVLVSAWNPHVILLPALCLIVLGAALWCGNLYALPLATVVATFLIQTHVASTMYAAAILGVSTTAAAVVNRGGKAAGATVRRSLYQTCVLMVVLWALPVAEQAAHTPGNLMALWEFFVVHPGLGQPLAAATAGWTTMVPAVLLPEPLLPYGAALAPELDRSHVAMTVVLLSGAIVVAIYAFRTRRALIAALATLSVVGALAAWWSATRIDGSVNDHLIFWFAAVGISCVAVMVAGVLTWVPHRVAQLPRSRRLVSSISHAVPLGALLWMGLSQVDRARQGHFPVTLTSAAVPNFATSIRGYMRAKGVRRPLIRLDQDKWALTAGILLELQRGGAAFAIEDSWASMFPSRFRINGDEDAELTFAAADTRPELAARPGNVTIDSSRQIHVEAVRLLPRAN